MIPVGIHKSAYVNENIGPVYALADLTCICTFDNPANHPAISVTLHTPPYCGKSVRRAKTRDILGD